MKKKKKIKEVDNDNNDKNIYKEDFNKIIKQLKYVINKYDKYCISTNYVYHNIHFFINYVKDTNCIPFWNNNIKKVSDNIFLPTKDNIKHKKLDNCNTWYKNKYYKIRSNHNKTINKLIDNRIRTFKDTYIDKRTKKVKNIIKCNKIKLFLKKKQREGMNYIFGCYRYFYNRAIQYINNYDKDKQTTFYLVNYNDDKTKKEINLKDVKNKFKMTTMRNYLKSNYPNWIKINIPSHLIDKAFKEAEIAYEVNMEKFKKYKKSFTLKFKTKKDKQQTIQIESSMIHTKYNGLFVNMKINNKYIFRNLKTSLKFDQIKDKICDSSISHNRYLNTYYLNLNYEDTRIKNNDILKNNQICSIDPGVRTFLSVYSDNLITKIGTNATDKIYKVCKEVDIITSRINKKDKYGNYVRNHNSRRNLKRALHRKIEYLKNLKQELHNKSIKYLCDRYSKIIIPPFEIQGMVGKLHSKTARSMYNLSHYSFRMKLEQRCKEYDINLIVRPEYYTSKTCGRCGNIKHNLGSDKLYKCDKCKLEIDRDINGARNIMLRNM